MADIEPSSIKKEIRIGSFDARSRWAKQSSVMRHNHELGIKTPEVSTDNPLAPSASAGELDQPGVDTKQSAQITIESVRTHEGLPPVELPARVLFAGKVFVHGGGATDFNGNNDLMPYYNRQGIADSWYANDHFFGNPPSDPISVKPAKFSAPKIHIYAVRPWGNSVAEANLEWMTEGDWDKERDVTNKSGSSRIFSNTEMRLLDPNTSISLLQQGYNPWTALTDRENLIWTVDGVVDRSGRNAQTTSISAPGIENILITGNEHNLWENKQWLQDDMLTAAIADTYREITQGKYVILTKPDANGPKQSVLVAQALAQMVAAKHGKHVWWVTEPNILASNDRKFYSLTFADKKPQHLQPGDVFINLPSSRVTADNQTTVENIRKAFSNPLPQALEMWKNLP